MAPWPAEHPDPERLQQRTVRVLVAAKILGGAAIGVGAAVSPLLAKEILTAAWSGEPVDHHSEHHTVGAMRFLPRRYNGRECRPPDPTAAPTRYQ
jgi:hypothetical protein